MIYKKKMSEAGTNRKNRFIKAIIFHRKLNFFCLGKQKLPDIFESKPFTFLYFLVFFFWIFKENY